MTGGGAGRRITGTVAVRPEGCAERGEGATDNACDVQPSGRVPATVETNWLEQVVEKCGPDTLMFIVANKCDWADKEEVSMKEASVVAKKYKAHLH